MSLLPLVFKGSIKLFKFFLKIGLETQIAIICSILCLTSGLILTFLASVSNYHLQQEGQELLGKSLAEQLGRQIIESIETGDLIDLVGSLKAFTTDSPVRVALAYDIEGNIIASSGEVTGVLPLYNAPIMIGKDLVGRAVIELDTYRTEFLQIRFSVSLLGLAILFCVIVFFITRRLSLFITLRLQNAVETLSIDDTTRPKANNVLIQLERQIDSLPLMLLRSPVTEYSIVRGDKKIAIIFLKLEGPEKYLQTLDEGSFRRYVDRIQQIISHAADFYKGYTKNVRLFGSAIFFDEREDDLSAAFRAISCGQLIRSVQQEIQGKIDLSIRIKMAADLCQVETGKSQNLYSGIFIQTCLNDLEKLCESSEDELLLSKRILGASEAKRSLGICEEGDDHSEFVSAGYFDVPELDLIDRQRWMIIRKVGILS